MTTADLKGSGKVPCLKHRLARVAMRKENKEEQDLIIGVGRKSTDEDFCGRDDRILQTSSGVTGVRVSGTGPK